MSFLGKLKRSAPSWQPPELASPPSTLDSRMEVSAIQGRPPTGAGTHRNNSTIAEIPAVKARAIACETLESESTATTSASECSLGSDADLPLSIGSSSIYKVSPTYEPTQAITCSPPYTPAPEPHSKIGKHSSGSRIKRSHSKDAKHSSKEGSPKTKHKNSRPGSHIVPPLPPLPDPVKVAQDDEISRLKALLVAKDRIIEDQQRKIDSYALDATKSVLSPRPSSPPSTSSPNLATSPSSSPTTSKRGDMIIPIDSQQKPEVKKDKPSLRRAVSDNALKKFALSPRAGRVSTAGATPSSTDNSVSSSTPPSSPKPPISTSTISASGARYPARGGSMIVQPHSPSSEKNTPPPLAASPKKGSFITNLLARRADSPKRSAPDGPASPPGSTVNRASGTGISLLSSSGRVKSSASMLNVAAIPPSNSQSAQEAELTALRAQVRLLSNLLMIEQENSHRRDGGSLTDRSARSDGSSSHRRSGSFAVYNGEWVRIGTNGAVLSVDQSNSSSGGATPLVNRSRSSSLQNTTLLFGQPLEILLSSGIPKFFCRMTYHLESQGGACQDLLSALPDTARIATLKASINAGQDLDYQAMKTDASVVAALLRVFLRELPLPLLSVDTERSLLQATEIEDSSLRQSVLHVILNCNVSAYGRVLLQRLLAAFSHLHQLNLPHCNAEALAQFFGPSLFGYTYDLDAKTSTYSTMQQRAAVKALERLIDAFPHMHLRAQTMQFSTSAEEGLPRVKCASLRRAVELLFDPNYDDEEFVRVMVMMMHHFISPLGFAGELFTCYHAMVTCSPPKLWQQRIIDRMSRVLELWAKEAPPPSSIQLEFSKTVRFCNQSAVHPLSAALIDSLCKITTALPSDANDASFSAAPMPRTASIASAPFPGVKLKLEQAASTLKLMEFSADSIAEQMTLIEMELFEAIPSSEFLSKQMAHPSKTPRFHTYVRKFNEWSRWCATEILSAIDASSRIAVLARMIDLATICRRLNNFSTALALYSGMNMICISRLRHLWEKVPKKQLRRYRKLDELLSMDNNYRILRAETRKATLPAIPHLGLYSKTLATLEESSPTRLDPNMLINIEKLRAMYRVAEEVRKYQSVSYQIAVHHHIRAGLKSLRMFDDDQLTIASQSIMPREQPK